MDKKILYIGIAVLVAAILVLMLNVSNTSNIANGFSNVLVVKNLSVGSGNFSTVQLNTTNSSYLFIIAEANKPSDMYLLNASGFAAWKLGISENLTGVSTAKSLEGNGVLVVYANAINATIPGGLTQSSAPLYTYNESGFFPAGQYYFVVDNTNGSASYGSSVYAKIIYVPPITNSSVQSGQFATIGSQVEQEIVYGTVFFVLIIAGAVLVLYGFFKKPKGTESGTPGPQKLAANADKEYVDKLYKNIEKRKKAKKKA